jgi:hypothetical protein
VAIVIPVGYAEGAGKNDIRINAGISKQFREKPALYNGMDNMTM